MNMLSLTKTELDKHSALSPQLNSHIQHVVNAIPFTTVAANMKSVIAATQITAFASQFRRNILLWDGTEVPINAISFVITGSGGGKDSSVHAARKCFSRGYEAILNYREKLEVKRAIAAAVTNGEDASIANSKEIYSKYIRSLPPVDIMPTTGPGLIQHINDIGKLDVTTGFMYAGEFSDELAYNPDMMEDIKILSEMYDIGNKEVKYTKGVEHRSEAISGQAISALFVGSPGHILYDEMTKKKFHVAFMSKLARRSWFCYAPARIPEIEFLSIDEMFEHQVKQDTAALNAREAMAEHVMNIVKFGLASVGVPIQVSEDVRRMFEVYKRYNADLADASKNQDATSALIRRHLQWKALKLAGALAIFDLSHEITLTHYVDAIRFCELLDKDMETFEHDLNKAAHERFSDYMRTLVQSDGKAIINVHDIKKNNYISTVSHAKLQELVHLCTGYDTSGIYSIINDGGAIQYETITKTEVIGISFKPISTVALNRAVASGDYDSIRTAKHDISVTTAYGFEVTDTTFADLGNLLEGDYAYSPFKFRNGTRSKDNILGGTAWGVLDLDKSFITASEAHFMLSDIQHLIALSSDPANEHNYRVLIKFDAEVKLNALEWRTFIQLLAEDLGLQVDLLPQSQIYFSYSGRPVLTNLDAAPYETRRLVTKTKEQVLAKSTSTIEKSSSQAKALLADPLTTFSFAFNAKDGEASRQVVRAIWYAKLLGASLDDAFTLFNNIQEYWEVPFSPDRQDAFRQQITRMY